MAGTRLDRTKIIGLVLAALCIVGMSGCKSSTDSGPATAADKKAFAGVNDPAQKAKDMAAIAAMQKNHPPGGAPPAGAGH